MNYLLKVLSSRTVWTGVVIVLVNGIPSVRDLLPVSVLPIVDSILGLLAIYFRVKPKVNF